MSVALILLAGGIGSRMQSEVPKQFLKVKNKEIIFYSLDVFKTLDAISEIIVVADPKFRSLFSNYHVKWAMPGERRQDSLFNGLQSIDPSIEWVCVHDAARPMVTKEMVLSVIEEGKKVGAATAAIPIKATLKEGNLEKMVSRTLDRSHLWEIQTPQVVAKSTLEMGLKIANQNNLTVTDDTSLASLCQKPVKLVQGSSCNIKITTPDDLELANALLS